MARVRYALIAVVLFALLASAAPKYSPWSAPLNLGAVLNSPFFDQGPALSKDGLSLYFASNRPGGFGGMDIWVSQRASLEAPWGAPMNLGQVINTADADFVPSFSRDDHWMFFNSTRPGLGGFDIWVSYREHTKDDFGWQQPVNLGPPVNTPFNDAGANYFEDGDSGTPLLFFNSERPGGPGLSDIYVTQILPNGSLSPASLVPELSSPALDQRPSVRFDGLEVVFFSDRRARLVGLTCGWRREKQCSTIGRHRPTWGRWSIA